MAKKNVLITFKVPDDVREAFDKFCDAVGASRSTVLNMFIMNCVNTRTLPFKVATNESFNLPDPE